MVHEKNQFVKKDRMGMRRGASRWRGTQVMDRQWDSLDSWIGREIPTKKKGVINDALWDRVRSFQWRSYYADKDKYKLLGSKCK